MITTIAVRGRRRLALVLAFFATIGATVALGSLPAHAEGTASAFVVQAEVGRDGILTVQQQITFSGAAPAQLSQKFETRQGLIGDREYVYTLSDLTATAGNGAVTPTQDVDGRYTTVSIPTNGSTTITMGYKVSGAVVGVEGGGTALRWRLLQGLSAQVTAFTASVAIPTAITYVDCTAGPPNATLPCTTSTGGAENGQVPTFTDGPRGEGEVVAIDIGFPPGTVTATENIDYVWTLGRAFSARPLQLGIALGLLVLGAIVLFALHRRTGVDASSENVAKVGEFAPTGPGQSEFRVVDEIRPGHVGTVADERVDPIDITATLLDLAVRGHLLITELPRSGEFGATEWEISRREAPADQLRPFEQELLDGITGKGPAKISELPARVSEVIGGVQDKLYDEVVTHGWYARRPDVTRNVWTNAALLALIVAVAATGLLAAFTTFGLVGLALIAIALGLMFVGQEMPARTAKGMALLSGLSAMRSDLLSQPTNQMPPGQELRELSEVLPYAVVLGGSDRWLAAIVAADDDEEADSRDLSWYHGPENWHLRDLPASLRNFITTVSGTLFSR